jgi:hypothetical protein
VSSLIVSKLAFAPVIVAQERAIRAGLCVSGIAALVLALGFFQSADWATELWPWEDSPLSFVFLASILAAIALPALWIGVTGELAAIQAGAFELSLTYGAVFVYLATLAGDPGQPELSAYLVAFGGACASSVAAFAWSRRIPWRDQRRMPNLVWVSFGAIAVILTATGAMLVLDADIFPWDLRSEASVIFGFIFLGAAVFFAYGFLRPRWPNAAPQLVGFLAYDIVLIGPFIDRFDEVDGRQLASLIVYTTVLLLSAALAFHSLFVYEPTRLGSPRR